MKKFMTNKILTIAIFILSLVYTQSCAQNNIIFQSAFEKGSKTDYSPWIVSDTSAIKFVKDSTLVENQYSLDIVAKWAPPAIVYVKIPLQDGTGIYKLSFKGKSKNIRGSAWIGKDKDSAFKQNSVTVSGNSWKDYSLVDTLSAVKGDSVYIILRGGFSELLPGDVRFSSVKLEKIE
jgi:hypothetical protein